MNPVQRTALALALMMAVCAGVGLAQQGVAQRRLLQDPNAGDTDVAQTTPPAPANQNTDVAAASVFSNGTGDVTSADALSNAFGGGATGDQVVTSAGAAFSAAGATSATDLSNDGGFAADYSSALLSVANNPPTTSTFTQNIGFTPDMDASLDNALGFNVDAGDYAVAQVFYNSFSSGSTQQQQQAIAAATAFAFTKQGSQNAQSFAKCISVSIMIPTFTCSTITQAITQSYQIAVQNNLGPLFLSSFTASFQQTTFKAITTCYPTGTTTQTLSLAISGSTQSGGR